MGKSNPRAKGLLNDKTLEAANSLSATPTPEGGRAAQQGFGRPVLPLPVYPVPLEDELFGSWLSRLAQMYHLEPATLVRLLKREHNSQLPQQSDDFTSEDLSHLSARTGLSEAVFLEQMPLSAASTNSHPWQLIDSGDFFDGDKLISKHGYTVVQACPLCLKSDPIPYLRRSWCLELATVCLKHGCALIYACPKCDKMINVRYLKGRDTLQNCHACGHDLTLTSAPPVASQRLIDTFGTLFGRSGQDVSPLGRSKKLPTRKLAGFLSFLYAFFLKFQVYQFYNLEGRLDFQPRADIRSMGVKERRHATCELIAWLLEGYPVRLKDLARLAGTHQEERKRMSGSAYLAYRWVLVYLMHASEVDLLTNYPLLKSLYLNPPATTPTKQARFTLSDAQWRLIEAHFAALPDESHGMRKYSRRETMNAILSYLLLGDSWRDAMEPGISAWSIHWQMKRWMESSHLTLVLNHLYRHFKDAPRLEGGGVLQQPWYRATGALFTAPATLELLRTLDPMLFKNLLLDRMQSV